MSEKTYPSYEAAFKAAEKLVDEGARDLTFEEVKKRGGKLAWRIVSALGRPDLPPTSE